MNDQDKIKILEDELAELKEEFHVYVKARQQEESRRLRTALMFAGGVILTLGAFIWTEVLMPVIKAGRP